MKRFLILMTAVLLLLSCSKKNYTIKNINGIRIVNNKNIPNAPDMELKLKKLYEIDVDSLKTNYKGSSDFIKFDEKGSLYIMDPNARRVHKYDRKGRSLKSFCNEGQGPGEVVYSNSVHVKNGIVTIFDTSRRVYNYFNTDGKFLSTGEEKIKGLVNLKDLGNRTAYYGFGFKKIEGLFEVEWGLYNLGTASTDTMYNYVCIYQKGYNMPSLTVKYDTYKENLCFLYPDPNKFKIEIFDINSQKVSEINMYHRLIKNSDEEIKKIREYNKNSGRKLEAVGRLPVSSINFDKYGNIWAERFFDYSQNPEYKEKTVYDVFNQEGVYLNRIINNNDYSEPFIDDKYIEYDEDKRKFTIYDYELLNISVD